MGKLSVKDKKEWEIDREFDSSRIERTIEKMFELWWAPTMNWFEDLIKPIADKIIEWFDKTRSIKESWILKAIEREIEQWVHNKYYPVEAYKWMITYLNGKWFYDNK